MIDLTPNTIAHYKLNDNLATTVVVDSSGNGNDGTALQNTEDISVAGKIGTAFEFNGSSDYIEIDAVIADLASSSVGAISFWVYHAVTNQSCTLISFGDTDGVEFLNVGLAGGTLSARCDSGATKWSVRTTADIPLSEWVHCEIEHNGTEAKIYLNGALVTDVTWDDETDKTAWFSDDSLDNLDNARIGCIDYNNNGNHSFFSGKLDIVTIFDKTLSAAEKAFVYNSGAGIENFLPDEVEPSGAMGKAKINLRNLVAESETFQNAIGAAGTTEEKIAQAKERIHLTAYASETLARPFALIVHTGNDKNEATSTSQSADFTAGGDLELRLERDIPQQYKDQLANGEMFFENFVEGVKDDCFALTGLPGYFVMNSWDTIDGPAQYEIEEGVFVSGVRILINWGLGGP